MKGVIVKLVMAFVPLFLTLMVGLMEEPHITSFITTLLNLMSLGMEG
jgi:hypothetical protein